jgi:hypothetical protein
VRDHFIALLVEDHGAVASPPAAGGDDDLLGLDVDAVIKR